MPAPRRSVHARPPHELAVTPTGRLLSALSGLHGSGFNWTALSELHRELERRRASMPADLAPGNSGFEPDIPTAQVRRLLDLVAEAVDLCEQAAAAIREGGAAPIDRALGPGSSSRAVTMQVEVSKAIEAFGAIRAGIMMPKIIFGEQVAAILAFRDWCADQARLLRAAVEAGSGACPPTNIGEGGAHAGKPEPPRFAHSADFSWVVWGGTRYVLTKGLQAEVVRALWRSWEESGRRDGCGLSEQTLREACGSSNDRFRMVHVFRGHPALGTMIRSAGKGVFALYAPESPPDHHL